MMQAAFGLAFCIGAVMCSVVGATTIATGLLSSAVIIAVHRIAAKVTSGIYVHTTAVEARAWLDANMSAVNSYNHLLI